MLVLIGHKVLLGLRLDKHTLLNITPVAMTLISFWSMRSRGYQCTDNENNTLKKKKPHFLWFYCASSEH